MTRLLSMMTEARDGFRFHMSSLKPINPANSPDGWEREALLWFETGATDRAGLFNEATGPVFRYMGRLTVEAGCLHCHERQGYQLGEVRGGIRVSLPWAPFQATLGANQRQLAILHGAILTVLLILLWSGGFYLMRTAREVEALNRHMKTLNRRLETAALTDALTGMANRMHFDRILEAHRPERMLR